MDLKVRRQVVHTGTLATGGASLGGRSSQLSLSLRLCTASPPCSGAIYCRQDTALTQAVVVRGAVGLLCTCAGPCQCDDETGGRKCGTQSYSEQAPSPPLLPTQYHAILCDRWPIRTNCAHRPQSDQPGQRPSSNVGGCKAGGFMRDGRRATVWVTDCHQAELGAQATPSAFSVPCTTVE